MRSVSVSDGDFVFDTGVFRRTIVPVRVEMSELSKPLQDWKVLLSASPVKQNRNGRKFQFLGTQIPVLWDPYEMDVGKTLWARFGSF